MAKTKTKPRSSKKAGTKVFDVSRPARAAVTPRGSAIIDHRLLKNDPPTRAEPNSTTNQPNPARPLASHSKTIAPPQSASTSATINNDTIKTESPPMPTNDPSPQPQSSAEPAADSSQTVPPTPPKVPPAKAETPTAAADKLAHEAEELIASKAYIVPIGTVKHRSMLWSLIILLLLFVVGGFVALSLGKTWSI